MTFDEHSEYDQGLVTHSAVWKVIDLRVSVIHPYWPSRQPYTLIPTFVYESEEKQTRVTIAHTAPIAHTNYLMNWGCVFEVFLTAFQHIRDVFLYPWAISDSSRWWEFHEDLHLDKNTPHFSRDIMHKHTKTEWKTGSDLTDVAGSYPDTLRSDISEERAFSIVRRR